MKFKFKYLFILCLFLIPLKVNAASVSLNISCPQAASAGQTINCTIATNNSGDLSGISAKYKFTGGATYVNFAASGSYSVSNIQNNGFNLGNNNGLASYQVLGTLSVLIPSTAQAGNKFTIGLTEINGATKDYEDIYGNDVSATVSVLSSNANLASLSISGASINFNAGNTYYEVSISSYNTTISATAADGGASVSGAGYKSLREGKNTFYITVTAPSGAQKTYTVVINTPVTPKPQQPIPPTPQPDLQQPTTPETPTTPEQPEEKPEEKKDSNTNLKKLTLDIAVLAFNKNKTNYEISVDNEIDKVTVEAVAESEKSTVIGNGEHELVVGSNTVNIVVTAENGYIKTYEIIIVREKPIVISNSNKISSLKINGIDFKFDPEKNEYDITTELKSLDFKIDLYDENSSYKISGNNSLITGSEVRIRVTDAEGNINVYKLNITVPETSNEIKVITEEKVSYLPVIIVSSLLVLVVGGTIIYLIIKKRKEDNEDEVYEIVELRPIVQEAPEVLEMETKEIPVVQEKKVEEVKVAPKPIEAPKPTQTPQLKPVTQPEPVVKSQPRPVEPTPVAKPQPAPQPRPVVQQKVVSRPAPAPQQRHQQAATPVANPQPRPQAAVPVAKPQPRPQQPRPVAKPQQRPQQPVNRGEAVIPVSTPPKHINK